MLFALSLQPKKHEISSLLIVTIYGKKGDFGSRDNSYFGTGINSQHYQPAISPISFIVEGGKHFSSRQGR